jgi:hypothetical protein
VGIWHNLPLSTLKGFVSSFLSISETMLVFLLFLQLIVFVSGASSLLDEAPYFADQCGRQPEEQQGQMA